MRVTSYALTFSLAKVNLLSPWSKVAGSPHK